jgi:hypothetical protein
LLIAIAVAVLAAFDTDHPSAVAQRGAIVAERLIEARDQVIVIIIIVVPVRVVAIVVLVAGIVDIGRNA